MPPNAVHRFIFFCYNGPCARRLSPKLQDTVKMNNIKKSSSSSSISQEIASVTGLLEEIVGLQNDLSSMLEGILERRNAVKKNMDEKEIEHIVTLFVSLSKKQITQRILNTLKCNSKEELEGIKMVTPTYTPVSAPRISSFPTDIKLSDTYKKK